MSKYQIDLSGDEDEFGVVEIENGPDTVIEFVSQAKMTPTNQLIDANKVDMTAVLNTNANMVASQVMLVERGKVIYMDMWAIREREVTDKDVFIATALTAKETAKHFLNWATPYGDGGYGGYEYPMKSISDTLRAKLNGATNL